MKIKKFTCMPFLAAAYAHGANDPIMMKGGRHVINLDDRNFKGELGKCWKKVGLCKNLSINDLQPGDVVIKYDNTKKNENGHAWMYIGEDKYVEAVPAHKSANEIAVKSGAAKKLNNYKTETRTKSADKNYVMRYIGQSGSATASETQEATSGSVSRNSAQVIDGACAWAEAIATDDSFHYGDNKWAHHNGCYFCGTQPKSKRKGGGHWEKTYCCNPFVHAAFAHGGGDKKMLEMCKRGKSYYWDTYPKAPMFQSISKPNKINDLVRGDVLCWDGHVMLYIGDGKIAHASGGDDDKPGSIKWKKSIRIEKLSRRKFRKISGIYRYIGSGGSVMEIPSGAGSVASVSMTTGLSNQNLTPQNVYRTTLKKIAASDGKSYTLSAGGTAQSFVYANGKFYVQRINPGRYGSGGHIEVYDNSGSLLKTGSFISAIGHGNGLGFKDGKLYSTYAGSSGTNRHAYVIDPESLAYEKSISLKNAASGIGYDTSSGKWAINQRNNICIYSSDLKKREKTIGKRGSHKADYVQDCMAVGGVVYAAVHSGGLNYIDLYSEDKGDYLGSYTAVGAELEGLTITDDGELILLFHGTSEYMQFTGIKIDSGYASSAPLLDFTVSSKKLRISKTWDLNKGDITAGDEKGALRATAIINQSIFSTNGRLFNAQMRIKGKAKDGSITGSGWVDKIFKSPNATAVDVAPGKATYVGVDDTDTDYSRKVLSQTSKWSNSNNPFYNGYGGLCETWTSKIYQGSGLSYSGACCAYTHCSRVASKDGKIPKGAVIFSGIKRDGTLYENGHRSSAWCSTCHHWAGHVAIYVGNGLVAGSQIPYLMPLDTWIDYYGYGGWSLS